MPHIPDLRRGPDRRRQPRGGRRREDKDGFAPLVMLVGSEPDLTNRCEAILAKLKFAVTKIADVDQAIRVVPELRPDLVVAPAAEAPRMRSEIPQNLPVVAMPETPEAMIDEILRTLRKPATVTPIGVR